MDWKALLESLLPGLLQFLELASAEDAGNEAFNKEMVAAAVSIARYAFATVGVSLPGGGEVEGIMQSTINKMKDEGKLGDFREPSQRVFQRDLGEPIQPS